MEDAMAGAQWDKAYGEHRQQAWKERKAFETSEDMRRDAAGHDVTKRGQDLGHTSAMTGHEMTGRGQDFQKDQWGTANQLARDNLNQQGEQWGKTFDYGKERDKIGDSQWGQTHNRGVLESDRTFDQGVTASNRDYGLRLGQAELGGSKWVTNPETGQLEMVQTPGVQIDRKTGMPADNAGGAAGVLDEYFSRQQGQQGGQADSASPPVESQEQAPSAQQREPRNPVLTPQQLAGIGIPLPGQDGFGEARQGLNVQPPTVKPPTVTPPADVRLRNPSIKVRPWLTDMQRRARERAAAAPNKPQ